MSRLNFQAISVFLNIRNNWYSTCGTLISNLLLGQLVTTIIQLRKSIETGLLLSPFFYRIRPSSIVRIGLRPNYYYYCIF